MRTRPVGFKPQCHWRCFNSSASVCFDFYLIKAIWKYAVWVLTFNALGPPQGHLYFQISSLTFQCCNCVSFPTYTLYLSLFWVSNYTDCNYTALLCWKWMWRVCFSLLKFKPCIGLEKCKLDLPQSIFLPISLAEIRNVIAPVREAAGNECSGELAQSSKWHNPLAHFKIFHACTLWPSNSILGNYSTATLSHV